MSTKSGIDHSIVNLCRDHSENRLVALKTLKTEYLSDTIDRRIFVNELDTWLKIEPHFHIVKAHHIEHVIENPYLATAWVLQPKGLEYSSLRAWLPQNRTLYIHQALTFALHIAHGMKHATTQVPNLVHCNLKPENILVGYDGNARVTDFGFISMLSKISRRKKNNSFSTNTNFTDTQIIYGIVGTPLYMAPEQWLQQNVDQRTDIYALGCILYEMLTGLSISNSGSLTELCNIHLSGRINYHNLSLPRQVIHLLKRCTKRDRNERYSNWLEVENAIENVLRHVEDRKILSNKYMLERPSNFVYTTNDKLFNLLSQAHREKWTTLDLTSKNLSGLPRKIGELTHLRELNLGGNSLTTLPNTIIKLTNLETLHIWGNKFTSIPEVICHFPNLKNLSISYNKIQRLTNSISSLTNLERLHLQENQINDLPRELKQLRFLQQLDLRGNPLSLPQEILNQTIPQLLLEAYFQDKKSLHEAKLLIVGQGSVGKTSLMRRLTNGSFDLYEPQTHAINVHPHTLTIPPTTEQESVDIKLNMWDFGGQEIMHNTHQFFLTNRSLYLIVLNAREDEYDNRLAYWLNIVNALANNPPILIVVNKIDITPAFKLDERTLQYNYPNIVGFARVSCQTQEGLNELKKQIAYIIALHLPHIHDRLPSNWFNLKQELQAMSTHTITYSAYQKRCKTHNILNTVIQRDYLKVLHELGTILSYQDDPRLRDYGIMNRQWVVDAIYKILNAQQLTKSNGRLTLRQLPDILEPEIYPSHTHRMLLDLMQKFELCYPFDNNREIEVLIPDLLPKTPPDFLDFVTLTTDALAFLYQYETLPASILCRCMVRRHRQIVTGHLWRNGVVLERGGQRALLWSQPDEHPPTLAIYIKGDGDKRILLENIRDTIANIHPPKLPTKEMIPLPDYPNVLIPYENLEKLVKRGIVEYFIPEIDSHINPSQLLGTIKSQSSIKLTLHDKIEQHFNDSEINRELCVPLGVNPEEFTGSHSNRALQLVKWCERRQMRDELVAICRATRPKIDWGGF